MHDPPATSATERLAASEWQERLAAHRERARVWTQPMRDRRARGESHPVLDFLNTYYQFSLGKLETWQPGFGEVLEDSPDLPRAWRRPPYRRDEQGVLLDVHQLSAKKRAHLSWIRQLLDLTRHRAANFACHGLHEWAMVYSGTEIRHRESVPLRLPQEAIDALVDAHPLCCTHYDAFRFFAPTTRPRNRWAPDISTRLEHEQPGCIHANMDLYKWACKAMPWIGSDMLWECFLFATRCREIDMRASPYDLSSLGYPPIRIESEAGRREYEHAQLDLMREGQPLRRRLSEAIGTVLAAGT